ncbi:hypothetical protein [Zhihengliuella flava]|uniref:Uncharacterized protein n=1 Tax=Zhihengliuella flava TaxID=1285193 RepID=A0A931DB40_9MICC|nr:hypothetical protein [Zhihengliuella flava]MBG6084286.1 hypothetical protein [Zhihengliuella flava]
MTTTDPTKKSSEAATDEEALQARRDKDQHDHDDARVDEWEDESFPASDPPSNY